MLGPRIVGFEAVILLSGCLLFLKFFMCSHCVRVNVLGPQIVMFEAAILLSGCLLILHCFMCSHCVRVLCWVLGLWCLKR